MCGRLYRGKVNHKPARYRNCLLFTLLLGPIGFAWIALRSCLSYAGGMRADIRAQGDAARRLLAEQQNPGQ